MRKPLLLIVDDEQNVAATLRMVFEDKGYDVDVAYSSSAALHNLSNGRKYDAVLTDLNMESADVGLEVARAAGKLRPKPIIAICTGFASTSNSRVTLDMHVDYLATKPVNLEELISAFGRLLAHQRASRTRK